MDCGRMKEEFLDEMIQEFGGTPVTPNDSRGIALSG